MTSPSRARTGTWARAIWVLGVLVMIFVAFQWLFPSPEKVIRKRLNRLAGLISVSPGDSALKRMAAVSSIMELFASDVSLSLVDIGQGLGDVQGRDSLRELVVAGLARVERLELRFPDVVVIVGEDRQRATADVAAMAEVNRETTPTVARLDIEFRKEEGRWLIQRVTSVPLLK